jgi:NADP+-dependent farnesol dehydrogenase
MHFTKRIDNSQLLLSSRKVDIKKQKMEKWLKSVAVVTGANSGNGFAILKKFAELGITAVGVDIRTDAIDKLKGEMGDVKIYSLVCDVTKDEPTEAAFKWVEDTLGGIDILINNAGMIKSIGTLEHEKPMSELTMNVDLNFTAVVRCARLAFKSMETRDSYGYIVNMNSVYGHYIAPITLMNVGVYPGTKYAITATSEIMRRELIRKKNRKVRVTSVSPGLVQTNIFKAAEVHQETEDKLFNTSLVPEDIADTVCYLLSLPYKINVNEITVRATGSEL